MGKDKIENVDSGHGTEPEETTPEKAVKKKNVSEVATEVKIEGKSTAKVVKRKELRKQKREVKARASELGEANVQKPEKQEVSSTETAPVETAKETTDSSTVLTPTKSTE